MTRKAKTKTTPKKRTPAAKPAPTAKPSPTADQPSELQVAKDQLAAVRTHLQALLAYLQPQWIADSVRVSHQALVRFGRDGRI